MADQVSGEQVVPQPEDSTAPAPYADVVEDEDLLDDENAPPMPDYKIIMDQNFYYPTDHIENALEDSPISRRMAEFHDTFGVDSYKLYNFRLLDPNTVIYAAGISYKIHNLKTGGVSIFFSKDGGGVASIAVDKAQKYFAVAEKGSQPNIYVYEYPSLKLYRILRHGTEKSYSNCSFSSGGERLASVGSEPDYNICIWDWRNEILVLKAKAFSQEVFRVVFSDYSDTILSTSGMAHLRFWKIANTFTGLKLKGQTGKFGSVELSDIIGFFIFPDGKVLSGSENGKLLLWEGNLIKAVLNVTADKNCHEGAINTVIKVGPHLVSAGQDGYIRYWDFKTIDDCEADDYLNYFISPEKEYQIIPDGANVQEIVVYKEYWLVHDAKGRLFRVKVTTAGIQTEELFRFNSGKFKGLASSQDFNAVASIGQDGAIRLLDITNRKQYYNREFLGSGTCIDWCLKGLDKYGGRFAAVGFDNGIVRIVHFSQDKLFLLKALKVHNNPVTLVSFSPSSDMLAVLSSLGEIFFFAVSPDSQGGLNLTPICIHPLLKKVNQWCWGSRRSTLLIATDSGEVVELEVPQLGEFDSTQTYLNEKVKSRTFVIKMMEFQRPKIDVNSVNYLLDEKSPIVFVEWEPAPISSVTYLDEEEGRFLCAAEGPFLGYIYMCQFGEERPLQALPATQSAIRIINRSPDNNWILSGTDAGEVLIRPMSNVLSFAKLNLHDQNHGSVVGLALNPDMTCVVSASEDGTIMTQLIDLKFAQECAQLRHLQKIDREKRKQRKLMQLDEPAEEDKKEDGEPEEEGKAPEDDESSEDSAEGKFKADQYDFSIAALKPNIPSLTEGINETFFGGDMAGRTDSEDILNPNIYSIQEEKLLAEEDKRKSLAEERKKKMRADIATLRERFENLKKNNMSLDEFLRLEAKDFNIDDEYTQMLKARVAEMLDEAQKEVSYEIETSKMKTQKLKDFYLSELEFDRLAVAGFKKNISVHTMKVKFPSEWTQAFWRETDQKKLANASTAEAAGMQNQARDMGMSDQNKGTQGLLGSQEHNGDPNSIGGIIDQWINQNENKPIGQNYLKEKKEQLRKQQADKKRLEKEVAEKRGDKPAQEEKYTRQKIKADKELRSQMKQELSKRKPEDKKIGDDDPKIKEAKDKMGLYKLKSDPEYEVPDKQRMSMKRQRKTILLFEDFIHKTKREFNKSLLQMKDTKKHLFDKIIASNQRIREINERLRQLNPELKVEDALFVPSYNELLEFPDKFMQVTPEEVEDELKAREEDKKKKGAKGVADSKEEALGASGESDALAKSGTEKKPRVELQYRERKNIKTFPSAMEARHKEIMQLRLETEKRLLSEELETEILDFDERLEELAFKKIRFEYEMKFIQMNLITSYQELLILDAFEAKDKLLLEEHDRLNTKAKETSEAMKKNSAAIQKNRIDAKISEQNVKDAEAKFNEKLAGSKELANKAYEFYKQINQKKEKKSGEDDADNQDGGLDDDEVDFG